MKGAFLFIGGEGGIVGHFPVPYPTDSLRSRKIVPDNFFEPLILLSRARTLFHRKLKKGQLALFLILAEKEGFEPSIGINLYTLSRRAPSAARPLLQNLRNYHIG